MLHKLCSFLEKHLPHIVITRRCEYRGGADDRPLLYRFYLWKGSNGHALFLHRFVASDVGPELHNHPFEISISLLLKGGYVEERKLANRTLEDFRNGKAYSTFRRWLGPLSVNVIRASDFHRVELEEGKEVWTLFYHGPRIQEWGFLFPDGTFQVSHAKSRDQLTKNK